MAQPQMTEDQRHCANVARLLSATFPGSDPDVLTPLPPRGTEGAAVLLRRSAAAAGAVRRSFERVGPDEAVGLAEQHAREGLEDLYKAAGGGTPSTARRFRGATRWRGVAPPRVTLHGYVGAGGGRDLKVHSACEVRGAGGSWRGGVVEAVVHVDDEFDWDTSTFTVDLLDGDQAQGVRGGDIRAPQKLVERTVRTGLEGFGGATSHAGSPVGRAIALTTVAPETRGGRYFIRGCREPAFAGRESCFGEDDGRDDADRGADQRRLIYLRLGRGHDRRDASRAARLSASGRFTRVRYVARRDAPHVLDDAAAPTETALTTEADGDAMKIDAPPAAALARALPDATAPPLLGPGPATEPTPPTTMKAARAVPTRRWQTAPRRARRCPRPCHHLHQSRLLETTAASEPTPPTTTTSRATATRR